MTDIFTAHERLLRATMALMDFNAENLDMIRGGSLPPFERSTTHPEYLNTTAELWGAAVAYWEIARGRKWPA